MPRSPKRGGDYCENLKFVKSEIFIIDNFFLLGFIQFLGGRKEQLNIPKILKTVLTEYTEEHGSYLP